MRPQERFEPFNGGAKVNSWGGGNSMGIRPAQVSLNVGKKTKYCFNILLFS